MKSRIIALGKGGYGALLGKIAEIIIGARAKIARNIDTTQVYAYWFIGKVIIEHEQGGRFRADYGKQVLIKLSRDLMARFGKGFSVSPVFVLFSILGGIVFFGPIGFILGPLALSVFLSIARVYGVAKNEG